jgi:hypothetical protein
VRGIGTEAVFGDDHLEVRVVLTQFGDQALGGVALTVVLVRAILLELWGLCPPLQSSYSPPHWPAVPQTGGCLGTPQSGGRERKAYKSHWRF